MASELLLPTARASDTANAPYSGAQWYFYESGTSAPQAVYADAKLSTSLGAVVTADSAGKFVPIYFDVSKAYRGVLKNATGSVTLHDIDPINSGLASALAASGGSAAVGFLQAGAGAVARNSQAKQRETLSVLDFIPVAEHTAIQAGTTTTNVTSYINLALTYAQTTDYQEKMLVFPAGTYRVSQIALRDANFLTLHAEGTVNIVGMDGTQGWVFGDDRLDDLGRVETFTQNFRMTGGPWLIGPLAGQTYQRVLKLQNFKDSVFENLAISGTVTPVGGVGNRIGTEIDLSFNNGFYNCNFGWPGAPLGSDKCYAVYLGGDNANNNRFYNCRVPGTSGGNTTLRAIGLRVDSQGNAFYGCDVSAVHTCFELNAARGAVFINCYHEAVSRMVEVVFASTGCVFMPSYVDIIANGTAYDFASSSNIQTVGFHVIGGYHKFTGAGTTLLAKGANCYGLTFQPGLVAGRLPVTQTTGTDNGSGATTLLDATEVAAAKFSFPDTPVPSTNDTTLDCYKETSPTLTLLVGATAQTVTLSGVKETKIGQDVALKGKIAMAGAVSGTGNLSIGGLTYTAGGASAANLSISAVTYTGTPSAKIESGATAIDLFQTTETGTRSALTHANLSASSEIVFELTYTATA